MKAIKRLLLLALLSFYGCNRQVSSVYFKLKTLDESSVENIGYSMKIPNGYKLTTLVGGHNEIEKQFVYPDSSKLYISDFPVSSLNYYNILSLNDSTAKKRLTNSELEIKISQELGKNPESENITIVGRTKSGLFWKDIKNGYLSCGYVNVPESKKQSFDEALSSLIKK